MSRSLVAIQQKLICAVGLLLALSANAATPAPGPWKNPFAAPSGHKADVVGIQPGALFISEPSGGPRDWVGRTLRLHVKSTATALAAKVRQVRLFRLSNGNVPHSYADLAAGDCDIFISTVMPVAVDTVDVTRLESSQSFSTSYLVDDQVAGKRSLTDARWIAVFETAENSEPVFRILKADAAAYFSGGWVFNLLAKPPYTDQDVANALLGRLDVSKELRRRDKGVICHMVQMLEVADGMSREGEAIQVAAADCGEAVPPIP